MILDNNKLINLVKLAVTTGIETSNNDSQFPIQQIEYLGKVADCLIVFPYGQFSRLPKDQLLVVLSIGAEEENRVAMGSGDPADRPEIEQGEMVYFHPLSKTFLKFKNNGELEIDSKGDLNITVVGDCNITPSGIVNLGSGGDNIVRDTDDLEIIIPAGSSAGTYTVNIKTSGDNKST